MFRHFDTDKSSYTVVNLPNAISTARAIGGVLLGYSMATGHAGPAEALLVGAFIGASDAEGQLITLMDNLSIRYPRLKKIQDALRIYPSKVGQKLDPIADKIAVGSIIAGGLYSGEINPIVGGGILAVEAATSAVSVIAEAKGNNPKVSNAGKAGMLFKGLALGFNLATDAISPEQSRIAHDLFSGLTAASFTGAVALGGMSCYQIYKDYLFNKPSEEQL